MSDHSSFDRLFRRWERRAVLSKDDKRAIEALPWTNRTFARESYMLREGEPVSSCTLLMRGFAYRQKLVSTGARQIISFHIPGEFIDLQNLMLEVADHNVQSLGSSQVASVPRAAFLELMSERAEVRKAIWLDTLIDSSVFREWVVNVGRRSAMARIAHLLCEYAVRRDAAGFGPPDRFDLPMTQEQMGDATGLTSVHVNRKLHDLEEMGVIARDRRALHIRDRRRLMRIGDFDPAYLHGAA